MPMMQALTNPSNYKATYDPSLSDSQVTLLGEINGDSKFTNADLPAFLDLLKSGGGSSDPVPEPSTLAPGALGVLGFGFVARHKRHRRA